MRLLIRLISTAVLSLGWASATTIPPAYDHIVMVIEENKGYSQIFGSASAPYINSLVSQSALLTNSFAFTHPSQPNYLDLFSGSAQGVTTNTTPPPLSSPNLGSLLIAAGYTFTGYSEDLPFVGYTGDNFANYFRKHNPWVDFTNVPTAANRPFTDFPSDFSQLPNVAIVVPNQLDDMHDGTIPQGDSWLQASLGSYISWAPAHNSLFILTFDEDNGSEGNHVFSLLLGKYVVPGSYNDPTTHERILRTIEESYHTGYAGNSPNVAALTSMFDVPEPGGAVITVWALIGILGLGANIGRRGRS